MIRLRFGICLMMSLLGVSSCGIHYVSVTPTAPLLQHPGDLAVSLAASTAAGVGGSIAFAPIDKLSFLVEGSHVASGSSDSGIFQRYQTLGAALGTQLKYGEKWRGDLFIGYTSGASNYDGHGGAIGIYADSGVAKFHSPYVQSAIGFNYSEDDANDVFGYQLRLVYLAFADYLSVLQEPMSNGLISHERFDSHSDLLIADHSLFVRFGMGLISGKVFLSHPLVLMGKSRDLHTQGSLGLSLELRHNLFGVDPE